MPAIDDLIRTVAALRDPNTGCPWDIDQDHQSIAECLIDECCELLQTIDRLDFNHMEEELGDVLLQVLMHSQMGQEVGHFDFESICREVNDKLIRRHPHVFGSTELDNSDDALNQWDKIKAVEHKRGPKQKGKFKDLPRQLPALTYAKDVYKQLEKLSISVDCLFDHDAIEATSNSVSDKVTLGKRLFELAAASRREGIDPESALRAYTQNIVDKIEET